MWIQPKTHNTPETNAEKILLNATWTTTNTVKTLSEDKIYVVLTEQV